MGAPSPLNRRWAHERNVLERLARPRDKDIAASRPSAHAVWHHTPKLFAKLEARNRAGPVRRAQGMRLLAGDF